MVLAALLIACFALTSHVRALPSVEKRATCVVTGAQDAGTDDVPGLSHCAVGHRLAAYAHFVVLLHHVLTSSSAVRFLLAITAALSSCGAGGIIQISAGVTYAIRSVLDFSGTCAIRPSDRKKKLPIALMLPFSLQEL